jgi:hypothetical protein
VSGFKSVHWVPSDPGLRWVKDPGIVIAPPDDSGEWKALTPNVVALPGGGYRMYFTIVGPGRDYAPARGVIRSAISVDGSAWEIEAGDRLQPFSPNATVRVVCPDVVPIPAAEGGGWRMYLEGQPAEGRPAVIVSARSVDGLAWEPEPGIRFHGLDAPGGPRLVGSPRCVVISDDPAVAIRYRLYVHSFPHPIRSGLDADNHIASASSADGMTFTADAGARIAQEGPLQTSSAHSAEVLRVGSSQPGWRMYYTGWQTDPVQGRIFAASSLDGLSWARDPEPVIDIGGRYDREKCSEPCVIQLPDGRYRMFYEASDEHAVWRILSATSVGSA